MGRNTIEYKKPEVAFYDVDPQNGIASEGTGSITTVNNIYRLVGS